MPLIFAAWIALVAGNPGKAVLSAWLWGFAAYLGQNWWVNVSLHDVGGMPQILALPMTLLFPAYLAIYPAAAVWLTGRLRLRSPLRFGLALPAAWTLGEWLRTVAFSGFGWGALGYSQIPDSPLAGFAPVGGVLAVSLALALLSSCLTFAFLAPRMRDKIICLALGLALCPAGGSLKTVAWTVPVGKPITVALIQGNIPQTLKFDPMRLGRDMLMHYRLAEEVAGAEAVILPESAIPVVWQTLPREILAAWRDLPERRGFDLALGAIRSEGEDYRNAVIVLPRAGDAGEGAYDKHHLVPFGEFHPLPALTDPLYRLLNMPMSSLSPGAPDQEPLLLGGVKVAFNICYEDGFGDELIASARRSEMLANLSNMAWFGDSAAMHLQLQHSQTRALENGRFVLRAGNTGITAVIAPDGKVTAALPRDVRRTLIASAQARSGETPYMKTGSTPTLVLCLLILLCAFLRARRRL